MEKEMGFLHKGEVEMQRGSYHEDRAIVGQERHRVEASARTPTPEFIFHLVFATITLPRFLSFTLCLRIVHNCQDGSSQRTTAIYQGVDQSEKKHECKKCGGYLGQEAHRT
jgi:hypothetical protein